MFEVQVEKINKANKDKQNALEEIVDFLNNQLQELKDNELPIYDEYCECEIDGFFIGDNNKICFHY